MRHPYDSSPQRDNFYGAVGLLVVAALACALMGSSFGFVVLCALIGVLCTRAPWARIVTLVIVAYVGLLGLLVSIFANGQYSFAGFVASLIAAAIFWLLLRPGMNEYFGSSAPRPMSYVVPVMPRPGALPHLQQPQTAPPFTPVRPVTSAPGTGSTQEQWVRLQHQLRAEQEKEMREQALTKEPFGKKGAFPWLVLVLTALVFAYASSVGGELGKVSMLLVIPGFIAAMLRWVHPRGFLLCVLALSGGLIVRPDWQIVGPVIRTFVQHHGPMVFAPIALLVYMIALCVSGLSEDCESAI